jgi:hypothetical protein
MISPRDAALKMLFILENCDRSSRPPATQHERSSTRARYLALAS